MSRRYLALVLPLLPLDRLRRQQPELAGRPLAVWGMIGNRRLLTATDAPGLFVGQALADAQAILPELVLVEADPAADAALLERLALWTLRFTPLAAVDGQDGLLLDTTGVDGLFGGEDALLASVLEGFRSGGYRVLGAVAGTPGCAAALARCSPRPLVLPPDNEAAALAPLPLSALRLPADTIQALARLGLRRVGELLRQPRGPLARRFGRALLDALDDATGDRPRPIRPVRPPPVFAAARNLLEPIVTRPAIDHVLQVLLAELCQTLEQAGQGARRLALRADRVDRMVQEVAIGTGAASHASAHLFRLFREVLDRLEPDLGFERMVLEATATEPMPQAQPGLDRGDGSAASRPEALPELLDAAGQRIALTRLRPLNGHWPEYAAVPAEPYAVPAVPPGWDHAVRPVRLLGTPLAIAVTALVPDGPPVQLRCGSRLYRVLAALGPERLEPEWWGADEHRPARDYYRVQTAEGPRLWICRLREARAGGEAPRWFLHGELA
ncbi:Y-family DNA polymerase [Pseudoroseomonas globiformis]|uniref:Y-family DNA polymerase n=1 Tax=Teichococcus globiformis TaxID=2307229 RepID=A0ABV7G6R1_9PROT